MSSALQTGASSQGAGLRHSASSYSGTDAFATCCAEAVRSGLEQDERPLVLAHARALEDVRTALGDAARQTTLVPIDEHTRNPSRLVTMLYAYATRALGARVLGVCELETRGQSPARREQLQFAESVFNTGRLAHLPLSVHCLYDDHVEAEDVAWLRGCHPTVDGVSGAPEYDAALTAALHARRLDPDPPPGAQTLTVRAGGLGGLRAAVRAFAEGHHVVADRAEDLVLAANEIVTNSIRYGGGCASVRLWDDGSAVVMQSSDHGYLHDPMTGLIPPRPDAKSGRGLWLAHHLCDLVQVRSEEVRGTTVRLFVDR